MTPPMTEVAMQQLENPVRRERRAKGKTQTELALLAKRSLSTIRLAERGIATSSTLLAISKALGVDVHALRSSSAEAA